MDITEEEKLKEQLHEQELIITGLYEERKQLRDDLERREEEVSDPETRIDALERAIIRMAIKLK